MKKDKEMIRNLWEESAFRRIPKAQQLLEKLYSGEKSYKDLNDIELYYWLIELYFKIKGTLSNNDINFNDLYDISHLKDYHEKKLKCLSLFYESLKEFKERKLKVIDFKEKVDFVIDTINQLEQVQALEFTSGGYPVGTTRYLAEVEGDRVIIEKSHSFENGSEIKEVSKLKFLEILNSLNLKDWSLDYYNSPVCDGHEWGLNLYFRLKGLDLRYSGHMNYPPNFKILENYFSKLFK